MMDKTGKEYEECAGMMSELIRKWEKIRSDEELVVMILPKYNQKAREEQIHQISAMLLREKWELPKENGLPRA